MVADVQAAPGLHVESGWFVDPLHDAEVAEQSMTPGAQQAVTPLLCRARKNQRDSHQAVRDVQRHARHPQGAGDQRCGSAHAE